MDAWRISRAAFARDCSGQHAAQFGARWNQQDHRALYVTLTPALCALEALMHARELPQDLKLVQLKLPDGPALYHAPDFEQLPSGWDAHPADTPGQQFGTRWLIQGLHLGLILPSSILPQTHILMLNPAHSAAERIEIVDISAFPHWPVSTTTRPRTCPAIS